MQNLSLVVQIQYRINVPIYLTPKDYVEHYEPNFLMLQLYYLYCKFKHVKAEVQQPIQIQFKDAGREIGKYRPS